MDSILNRLQTSFERRLPGVKAERMQLRTGGDPARWSVQQIVEHLLLTYTATSENYRQRLEKGTGTSAPVTMRARVGQLVVCTLGMFPKGRKSPTMVEPGVARVAASGDEMLTRVTAELRKFDDLAREAERIFGDRRALQHPVLGPMSVKHWRLFHLRHGEHHLRQIEAILKSPSVQSAAISSDSTPSATGR